MANDKKQNDAAKDEEVKAQAVADAKTDEVKADSGKDAKAETADEKAEASRENDKAEDEETAAEEDEDQESEVDEDEKATEETDDQVSEAAEDKETAEETDDQVSEAAEDKKSADEVADQEKEVDEAKQSGDDADQKADNDADSDADELELADDPVPLSDQEAKPSKTVKEIGKKLAAAGATKAAEKQADSNVKADDQSGAERPAKATTWRNRLIGTAAVSVLVGLGVGFGLARLGQPSGTAVRTAYGNISSASVYNRVKDSQDTVMNVQSMIMEKSLEHDFPKAATDKKVNARFNKIKHNKMIYYQELQQLGTDAAIKNNIRDSLLLEAAVAKNSQVTDAQVRAAYRDYRPGMTLAYVQVDSASRAKDVQQQLAKASNYKDFADQVTNLHNQDSKHVSAGHLLPQFSSLSDSQDVPPVIKKAAMKLHKGEVSPVVKIDKKTYVILYMKSDVKKSTYANDKQDIKKTLQRQEQTNSANRQKVMLKYAKQAHPKAVDASYKNLVKDMNQAAKQAE